MSTRTAISCTRCSTTAEVPADGDHSALWDAGWRWIGSQNLYSCPACPPVVVVDAQGRHTLPT